MLLTLSSIPGFAVNTAPSSENLTEISTINNQDDNIFKKVWTQAKESLATFQSGKSQVIAVILAIFVGWIGIHRFYLGYTTIGIIQLLTLGGLGIWTLIDIIRIITGDLQPADGPYEETFDSM